MVCAQLEQCGGAGLDLEQNTALGIDLIGRAEPSTHFSLRVKS